MQDGLKELNIKTIKFRSPKWIICPTCGVRQIFKKHKHHYKYVKDLDLNKAKLLKAQVVYAKCMNRDCKTTCFRLEDKKFKSYQRATDKLKQEAIAGLIDDNSTLLRISQRLIRSFNTTGSKSTIDRWKHEAADNISFKDIIKKLRFSGILSIDEYKPKRAKTYDLIASDAKKDKILYLESIPHFYSAKFIKGFGRGHIEQFLVKLRGLGVKPYAMIFDLATVFPKQARKVYPNVLIQFDYFHVIQEVQRLIRNAIIKFRAELKDLGLEEHKSELWLHKWRLLKNMDNWTSKDHRIIEELIAYYQGTIIEKALIFKEQLRDIFDNSKSRLEAYHKRYLLAQEVYWQDSYHLSEIMKFIQSWKFEYMITYLSHPKIPRSGNSERCIRQFRQMEKVRYGLTAQGRQNHLKLYQISKYLMKTKI